MNKLIEKNIEKIIIVYLFLQPLIDLITGITINTLKVNISFGMIIRTLFFAVIIYYYICIKKDKTKKDKLIVIITLLYLIIFGINAITNKSLITLVEIKGVFKAFFFPISAFIILKTENIKITNKHLTMIFFTYLILIFIPNLLNISYPSYPHSKEGLIGFFNAANEVGAILVILLPFVINYLKHKTNIYQKILIYTFILYNFFKIGTKTPVVGLILIGLFEISKYFIEQVKTKNYKHITIFVTGLIVGLISIITILPRTTFYKNLEIHFVFLGIERPIDVITSIENIDRFILSDRLSLLTKSNNDYKKSNIKEKFLGYNYTKNHKQRKMVEIDYYDIFYTHGIIGTLIYILILYISITNYLKNKSKKNNQAALLSLALAIILAFVTGHILTSPTVSIFAIISIYIIKRNDEYESKYNNTSIQ